MHDDSSQPFPRLAGRYRRTAALPLLKPLDWRQSGPELVTALQFLGQDPPPELALDRLDRIWSWTLANWRPERIPAVPAIGWSPASKAAPCP